jgi:tetratricopeptide (TPR) repeat protein
VNKKTIILVLLIISLFSCKSKLDEFEADLDEKILSQRGIEAIDEDNYKLALLYFQAIINNPPHDTEANLWAKYETANIYYKTEEYFTSLDLLDELILEYDKPEADTYPAAPLILANIIKEKILVNEDYLKELRRKEKKEEKETE